MVEHSTKVKASEALDIAEKFANGESSESELAAAWAAAWAAQKEMFIKMCKGEAPWQK